MISLGSDCLLFETESGEAIPFSADMISIEVTEDASKLMDPEVVGHATSAVFHYFKHELGRESVTMAEFAGALEKALTGLNLCSFAPPPPASAAGVWEADLRTLAQESGAGCDLFFFPRLRGQVQDHVRAGAKVLRFRGLRPCVKHLCGAQRWSGRCQTVKEQILNYLNSCLSAEAKQKELCLVVE